MQPALSKNFITPEKPTKSIHLPQGYSPERDESCTQVHVSWGSQCRTRLSRHLLGCCQRSVNFEMSFWCLQFSQKMNGNNSTWGTIAVKSNVFVSFLGELKIPKRHFEINWPFKNCRSTVLPPVLELVLRPVRQKLLWCLKNEEEAYLQVRKFK